MSVPARQPGATGQGPWFNYVVRRDAPSQRLLCLAGAGSGPSEFITWRSALPAHTELWPVQLPGREQRLREQPCPDLPRLVCELSQALKAAEGQAPLPLVLFGHSFGALVMYELARQIATQEPRRLRGLIVSGLAAPDRPTRRAPVAHLDDSELLAWVRRQGGTPQELLNDERFAHWLMRDLRASYRIRDEYPPGPAPALTCPISAFGGRGDFETSEQDLDAWSHRTSARFRRHILPGGHFFLREQRECFLRLLARDLRAMSTAGDPGEC